MNKQLRLLEGLYDHCKEQGRCNMYLHGIQDSITVLQEGRVDSIIRRDAKKKKKMKVYRF